MESHTPSTSAPNCGCKHQDWRDNRDPETIGDVVLDKQLMKEVREHLYGKRSRKKVTLSQVYDYARKRGLL